MGCSIQVNLVINLILRYFKESLLVKSIFEISLISVLLLIIKYLSMLIQAVGVPMRCFDQWHLLTRAVMRFIISACLDPSELYLIMLCHLVTGMGFIAFDCVILKSL